MPREAKSHHTATKAGCSTPKGTFTFHRAGRNVTDAFLASLLSVWNHPTPGKWNEHLMRVAFKAAKGLEVLHGVKGQLRILCFNSL